MNNINEKIINFKGETALAIEKGYESFVDVKTGLIESMKVFELLFENNRIETVYEIDLNE